jgi:hypothetical protein
MTEKQKSIKRKYQQWEDDFASTVKGEKALRLICHTTISHFKASNLKRHHKSNHTKICI